MTPSNCATCGGPLDEQTGVCPVCVTQMKTPSATWVSVAPAAPAAAPQIPGYRIESKLGEGGMGALYLAEETALGRRVAIKLISHRIAGDALSTTRFLREARTLATIEHPHVVRVYSFGEAGGAPYLVMEYVEGETLAERLARMGRLTVDDALRMTRQIIEALDAAWERKIVHRDIKPSNILLDRRNQVRVADFGLAKPAQSDGGSDITLTHTNVIVGTPHYVSPEQAQGKDVDFRSDIYSLGIMLYQMLTGERPFDGTTPVAIIAKHLHEPLPLVSAKRSDVTPSVERLVRSMTEKDPERRPPSYAKLLEAIAMLLGTTPSSEMPTLALSAETPRVRKPLVRLPLVYLAAIIIPLAVLFAVTKRVSHTATAPPRESRLVVAVAPFYGPDDDSAREGKLMAALIEREIVQKLGTENVRVIGIDETKKPLHSHDDARKLAATTNANAVIWGDAFALRTETEIQPHVTVIPIAREKQDNPDNTDDIIEPRADDAFTQRDRGGATVKLEAESPNQIELRKTSAAGIGDVITMLAGIRALDDEAPARAFEILQKAPQSAETLRYEVQALLRMNKTDEAAALLQRAVTLDPRDAASQALLGDILAARGDHRGAATAYTNAIASNAPFRAQRGIVANGLLYLRETYTSKRSTQGKETDTPYIIAIDPATDRVVERYAMPAIVQSFSPSPGGFVAMTSARDEKLDRWTFRNGKFDRYLWPPVNLLLRLRGLKSSMSVGANFFEPLSGVRNFNDHPTPPRLALSKTVMDDAPATLAGLDAELRRRMDRDPTQPWYPFLLAIVLDEEKHPDEAQQVFETMIGREYAVPYYEYSWMINVVERMRKTEWANALFAKTLASRQRLPQPAVFSLMIERMINANFGRQAACNADIARGYPVLQQTRQLIGMSTEAEDMVSSAWIKYFREHGDTAGAEREQRYLENIRKRDLNYYAATAKVDYARAFVLAALAGYVALLAAMIAAAWRRARSARIAARATPARLPKWLDVAIFAALALGFAAYVASSMREMNVAVVAVTVVLGVVTALTIHGRMADGVTVFDVVAALRKGERALLAGAFAMLVAATGILAWREGVVDGLGRIPIGISDSAGHPFIVREVEQIVSAYENPAGRLAYLAAVVNHYAGNTARAKQLYQSITTPAAAANLQALEAGKPPAVPLDDEQLYAALAPSTLSDIIRSLVMKRPVVPVVLALLAIPMLMLLLAKARPELAAGDSAPRFKLIERAALIVVPGGYDLASRGWLRAYAIVFAIGFLVLPVSAHFGESAYPAPGLLTAETVTNISNAYPLPFDARHPTPEQYGFWIFAFALPYEKLFWVAAALLAIAALMLHALRIPRILRAPGRVTSLRDRSTSPPLAADTP